MRAFQLTISGNWGHFKKPETNNNPLTHDFITKTAMVGLIGAVIGKDRDKMLELFPILCEDIMYGVQINSPVKKESWGFTMRTAVSILKKAPKHMEFLKSPRYLIGIALKNNRSEQYFKDFLNRVKHQEAIYTPLLGLHNCPANLSFISEGAYSEVRQGKFKTKGVVSTNHRLDLSEIGDFRIGFEKIPTYQKEFWNPPDKYVNVLYPSEKNEIIAHGEHYQYSNGECWWLL